MGLPLEKLGTLYDQREATIDADRARRYAAATNDPNEAYATGRLAPPVFGVVPTWEAMMQAVADLVPPELLLTIVHAEQDMHFHRPLVPGRAVLSRAEAHSVRARPIGALLTILVRSADAEDGAPVLDQYVTMLVRGAPGGESGGPDKPAHEFPAAARGGAIGAHAVHADEDQTYRYRDASGDEMPIHVDEAVAKAAGFPGIILHGLCTMAMASQGVVALGAGGDPGAVSRLAVRFSKPVFPGNDVVTTVYDAGARDGRRALAFESHSNGQRVLANGWAETRG